MSEPKHPNRLFWVCDKLDEPEENPVRLAQEGDTPNLTSSLALDGKHYPVLDLDIPHALFPSTTPGHTHLYLDIPLEWDDYVEVLDVLAKHGIIQKGFAEWSKKRGASFVRTPWTGKTGTASSAEGPELAGPTPTEQISKGVMASVSVVGTGVLTSISGTYNDVNINSGIACWSPLNSSANYPSITSYGYIKAEPVEPPDTPPDTLPPF